MIGIYQVAAIQEPTYLALSQSFDANLTWSTNPQDLDLDIFLTP